jgi:flagellar basal body rod protein FlgC
MSPNLSIFDISGRAMSAQLVRLNTTASNLANAGTVSGSEASAYRTAPRPSRSTASTTQRLHPSNATTPPIRSPIKTAMCGRPQSIAPPR